VVFLNLGLAESKIPGRELRAIAWFGAYLAARPGAPNAAAVKEAIAGLQIKAEGDRNRLIASVWGAASSLPHDTVNDQRRLVASLWAQAGEMTRAMGVVDAFQAPVTKVYALIDIANSQVDRGDRVGARQSLALAKQTLPADNTQYYVSDLIRAQLNADDIDGATLTANALGDPSAKASQLASIATAQALAGNVAGARATALAARQAIDLITNLRSKAEAETEVASAQVDADDDDAARATLVDAVRLAERPEAASMRFEISQSLAKAGDFTSAFAVADRIDGVRAAEFRAFALQGIATAQAVRGDLAGARRTAAAITDVSVRPSEFLLDGNAGVGLCLAWRRAQQRALLTVKPLARAAPARPIQPTDWLSILDGSQTLRSGETTFVGLNAPLFLDLSGALSQLRATSDPQKLVASIYDTTSRVILAKSVIDQMVRRQAVQQGRP